MNINGEIVEKAEMDEKAKVGLQKSMDLFYKSKSNPVDVKTYKKSIFGRSNDPNEIFSPIKGVQPLKSGFSSHSKPLFPTRGSRLNPSILEELKLEGNSNNSSKVSSPYNKKKILSSNSSPFNQNDFNNGFSPVINQTNPETPVTEGKLSKQNSLDANGLVFISSFISESITESQQSLDSKDDSVSEKDLQFFFPHLRHNRIFQTQSYNSLDSQ
jgi:hypothetical protein